MCGRFTLTADPAEILDAFPWLRVPHQMTPAYNIAPTQSIAVIPNDGKNSLDFFIWGLIPSWAKDQKIGSRMINARSETLAEKPSFRTAYKRRRCLVLADGFFEWQKQPQKKGKIPFYITMKEKRPFAFAGLWETWHSPDGAEIKSATIITTSPNNLIAKVHNRMPVILPIDSHDTWLSLEEKSNQELQPLLKPYPETEMQMYPVSTYVNSPANNTVETIAPLS
jgi:putative SOS response-associated peptidase YedK